MALGDVLAAPRGVNAFSLVLVGLGFSERLLAHGQLFQLGELQQPVPPGQVVADVLGEGAGAEEDGDERDEDGGVAGVPVGVDGGRVQVEAVLVVERLRRVLSGAAPGLLSQHSGKHRGNKLRDNCDW